MSQTAILLTTAWQGATHDLPMQIWWREKSDWKDKQQQNLETAGNHADSEGKGPECPSTISPRKPAGNGLKGSFSVAFLAGSGQGTLQNSLRAWVGPTFRNTAALSTGLRRRDSRFAPRNPADHDQVA